MKTNSELQIDVQHAIKWEPLLESADIGVTVKDGVVSLSGVVDSYAKKMEAEHAVKKVKGVKAIVENIVIKFPSNWLKSDEEVAQEVLLSLLNNWSVPKDKIAVKVEEGWVTLTGELPWHYQKEAANNAVQFLTGVRGVTNKILIRSENDYHIEKEQVIQALNRSAMDVSDVQVIVEGTTIHLRGKVLSWYQKEEADRIAWNTPGIWYVNNELTIEYDNAFG